RHIEAPFPEARLEIGEGHHMLLSADGKSWFLQCDVCLAACIDEVAIERRITIPAEVLRLIHGDLCRPVDSPGALPVQRHDSRLLPSLAKTVDDRLQPGVVECELRFDSEVLLLRGQRDLQPRNNETPLPEARLEVRDRQHLLLDAY